MHHRWDKLRRDVYSKKRNRFDLSKIPDIYDCIKYDIMHNNNIGLTGLNELYVLARRFADVLIPQEYGIDENTKVQIGQKIANVLFGKLHADFMLSAYGNGTSGPIKKEKMFIDIIESLTEEDANIVCLAKDGKVMKEYSRVSESLVKSVFPTLVK